MRLPVRTSGRSFSSRVNLGEEKKLTHLDSDSNMPKMVDVGSKVVSRRTAHARSVVVLPKELQDIFTEKDEINGPKGPIVATSIIAGTMAVKNTSNLIPFCHPLPVEKCDLKVRLEKESCSLVIDCIVATDHKTGVEMEALTGASVAALCIYDMCKAMSHNIMITDTRLISKTGGKSDYKSGEN